MIADPDKREPLSEEELTAAFRKAAERYGISDIKADFSPFKDLKVRWERSTGWIDFHISDYLLYADHDAIDSLAMTIMSKVFANDSDGYSDDFKRWLTSHEFRELNQQTYIGRNRTVNRSRDTGKLYGSYERLVSSGDIPEIPDLRLFWSRSGMDDRVGGCSCLMRVAVLNRRLDEDDVPEHVLDYCLLSELLQIDADFSMDACRKERMITNSLSNHPYSAESTEWIRENRLFE